MVSIRFNRPAVAGLVAGLVLQAAPALAQSPGSRAAGMADAFVAVADDATSVYWNPAGMATGALFSLVVDYGEGRGHGDGPPGAPGRGETDARFIGFTIPPLGIAYYRLHRAVAVPERPAGTGVPDREDERRGVRGLTTTHIGATLAQSLGDAVVVAGTFGLLRGGVSQAVVRAPDDESAIGLAEGAVHESTRFGIDAGVMVTHGAWRAGLVARNLTTPSFDGPEPDRDPVRLAREVRVGGAWGAGWPGMSRVVLSADADLTARTTASGDRRDVAAGGETWWLGQRLGLRAGLRASTLGEARPVGTFGVSAALRPGAFVEAHVARGARDERAWSIGARLTY